MIKSALLILLFACVILCQDCSSRCASAGAGGGTTIGTAPFCGGDCSEDCPMGNLCFPNQPANCWTGNKICCCDRKAGMESQMMASKFVGCEDDAMAIHEFVAHYNVNSFFFFKNFNFLIGLIN